VIGASRCYEWGEKFARFAKERDVEIAIERLGGEERKISFAANSANQSI
jgi:tRNA A37 threonylcarbamoyladenosine biosynthesis protein TsaE